ncbi:hypothetical protein [uncultured Campylobacter sp.]|uniref:hypothetical protein n=1 Tax=uncultured Campylobacter sp. TaxID=218934 RepID=UPI002616358D|nr:hypothetical protein [uncultured Campylobacter sp.]
MAQKKVARHYIVKFNLPPCKTRVKFGYSTRYGYETGERGRVILINDGAASWGEVRPNGFDYIAVSCKREVGKKTKFRLCRRP